MLASQRIEWVIGNWFWTSDPNVEQNQINTDYEAPTKRGATPTIIEFMILFFVSGTRAAGNISR